MKRFLIQIILTFLLAGLAAGCSSSKKDKEPKQEALTDYRESRELSPLEIPPDLRSEAVEKSLTVPKYEQKSQAQAAPPVQQKQIVEQPVSTVPVSETGNTGSAAAPVMYIERAGTQRWLVVAQPESRTWSDVRNFILASGLTLEREDRNAGLLETGWAENYAAGVLRGTQKFFNKYLGSVYTSPSRDKFIVRVEPGRAAGTSEVYLSHRGMIEKAVINNNVDPVRTIWEPIPSDANIEAEMLSNLMVELGATKSEATETIAQSQKAPDRATIIQTTGGQAALVVNDKLDLAWRRVGQSLDRVGFTVEDRDADKKQYFVRYADPDQNEKSSGFLKNIFTNKKKGIVDEVYMISLSADGNNTLVEVKAQDGAKAPDSIAEQIVKLMHEQLK
jgi:outer membrane protein assembly factor BamC